MNTAVIDGMDYVWWSHQNLPAPSCLCQAVMGLERGTTQPWCMRCVEMVNAVPIIPYVFVSNKLMIEEYYFRSGRGVTYPHLAHKLYKEIGSLVRHTNSCALKKCSETTCSKLPAWHWTSCSPFRQPNKLSDKHAQNQWALKTCLCALYIYSLLNVLKSIFTFNSQMH